MTSDDWGYTNPAVPYVSRSPLAQTLLGGTDGAHYFECRTWDSDACSGDAPCPCDDRHDKDKWSKVELSANQPGVMLELVLVWWRPLEKLVIEVYATPQGGYSRRYYKEELRAADGDIPYVVASGKTW